MTPLHFTLEHVSEDYAQGVLTGLSRAAPRGITGMQQQEDGRWAFWLIDPDRSYTNNVAEQR